MEFTALNIERSSFRPWAKDRAVDNIPIDDICYIYGMDGYI